MRQNGFVLPLVLFVIIAIASTSIHIFKQQNLFIENLPLYSVEKSRRKALQLLTDVSMIGRDNPWQNVDKNTVSLDGLFNVNHIVETTAVQKRIINQDQLKNFKKILDSCGLDQAYADKLADFMQSGPTPHHSFSLIDLVAFLQLPATETTKAFTCFRISSPLHKINLRFATVDHVQILLDVPKTKATEIKQLIDNGKIINKAGLIAYLGNVEQIPDLKKKYRHLSVSTNWVHAAAYWTYEKETFAYFEQKFEIPRGWVFISKMVLWRPELS